MDADTEQVTKRTRFSKNKKKNWGKVRERAWFERNTNKFNQFDQTEIDAALDKARSDERLHGGDISEVKNEDLFVIDTGKNKKKEPVKRKLIWLVFLTKFWTIGMTNVDRILSNKSMVPPPCQVENKKMTNRAVLLRNRKEINRAKTANLRAEAMKQVWLRLLVSNGT